MEKTVIYIEIALQETEESGIVSAMVVEMTRANAELILNEQENCSLVAEGGILSTLINCYGRLMGYHSAFFIRALTLPEENKNGEQEK